MYGKTNYQVEGFQVFLGFLGFWFFCRPAFRLVFGKIYLGLELLRFLRFLRVFIGFLGCTTSKNLNAGLLMLLSVSTILVLRFFCKFNTRSILYSSTQLICEETRRFGGMMGACLCQDGTRACVEWDYTSRMVGHGHVCAERTVNNHVGAVEFRRSLAWTVTDGAAWWGAWGLLALGSAGLEVGFSGYSAQTEGPQPAEMPQQWHDTFHN